MEGDAAFRRSSWPAPEMNEKRAAAARLDGAPVGVEHQDQVVEGIRPAQAFGVKGMGPANGLVVCGVLRVVGPTIERADWARR